MSSELFDHDEWLEEMEYIYSKFLEAGTPYETTKILPNVSIEKVWEAIYTCKPKLELTKEGS